MARRAAETVAGPGDGGQPPALAAEAKGSVAEALASVREDTREILELVRSLVALLLPKSGDDGPKLEDLIAALVAQQRDILIAARQIQADLLVLRQRTDGDGAGAKPPAAPGEAPGEANGEVPGQANGSARA